MLFRVPVLSFLSPSAPHQVQAKPPTPGLPPTGNQPEPGSGLPFPLPPSGRERPPSGMQEGEGGWFEALPPEWLDLMRMVLSSSWFWLLLAALLILRVMTVVPARQRAETASSPTPRDRPPGTPAGSGIATPPRSGPSRSAAPANQNPGPWGGGGFGARTTGSMPAATAADSGAGHSSTGSGGASASFSRPEVDFSGSFTPAAPPREAPLSRECRWRRDPAADWGRTAGTDVRRWTCRTCGAEGLGTERRGPQVCKRVQPPPPRN